MEGLLTNYYEYHFLYVSGIHHVESRNIQGCGADEAVLPPRHRHGPGDGRDHRLRQPVAVVHAARDGPPGRGPVRHGERAGRLSGALERSRGASARSRTWRCSACGRSSPACRASPRRRRSAATSGPWSSRSTRTGCGRTTSPPTTWSPPSRRATRSARPAMPASRTRCRSCRSTRWSGRPTTWGASPCASGENVYLRDVAKIEDGTDIPTGYALVNGRRAIFMLVTKRADASTLSVVNEVKAALAADEGGPAPGYRRALRVRPVPLRHAIHRGRRHERAAGRGPDRARWCCSSCATGGP